MHQPHSVYSRQPGPLSHGGNIGAVMAAGLGVGIGVSVHGYEYHGAQAHMAAPSRHHGGGGAGVPAPPLVNAGPHDHGVSIGAYPWREHRSQVMNAFFFF